MITVFIPVFNEESSLEKVISEIYKLRFNKEILVVDDGSTDNSFRILKTLIDKYKMRLVKHKKNMGKGMAIRTAIKFAKGEYFVIQDADLEYEPKDLEKVAEIIQHSGFTNQNLWAIGYRDLSLKLDFRFFHNFVNHLLTILINILFGGTIKDSYSGCKLIPIEFMKKTKLKSKRFEFEAEVCIKLLKKKYRVKQIQIKYNPRTVDKGKKIGILDAIKGLLMIIIERVT